MGMDGMKPTNEMNLRECNEEIEAAGGQAKKRIDHARNLVAGIRSGKTSGKMATEASVKRAVGEVRKNATVATSGQPALTSEQADNTETQPAKGGEEAHVAKAAKRAAVKAAKRAAVKATRAGKSNGKSIVADTFRSQYKKDKSKKTESGAPSVHCGDVLASSMAGLDNDGIAKVARENKVDADKWSKLNFGQIRMNLGNVLRGMIRRGEKVTVSGKSISKA